MDGHVYGAQLEVALAAITPEPQKVIEASRPDLLSGSRADE